MPRTDPVSGCQVMTLGEFWKEEADQEGQGRSAGELMAEFYLDQEKEIRMEEEKLKQPAEALKFLLSVWELASEEEPAEHCPVTVKEVSIVEIRSRGRTSSTKLVAQAEGMDGKLREYVAWSSYDAGSYLDPPDGDAGLEIKEL